MKEDTVIRVDTEKEQSSENAPARSEPRKKAGLDFELAADMNSPFLMVPFPQIFLAIGLMGFVCVFSLIFLIISGGFYYYGGYFFWMIFAILGVVVPDIFNCWWHWLLQGIVWCFYVVGNFIFFVLVYVACDRAEDYWEKSGALNDENKAYLSRIRTWNFVNTFLCEPALIVIALIMLRIAVHGIRNRRPFSEAFETMKKDADICREQKCNNSATRLRAGTDFEMAAGMNNRLPLLPFAQIYVLLALQAFVCLCTIVFFLVARGYFFYFGYFFFTLFVALTIVYPDALDIWWHWLIQSVYWSIYSALNILFFVMILLTCNGAQADPNYSKRDKAYYGKLKTWIWVFTFVTQPMLLLIVFILIRITLWGMKMKRLNSSSSEESDK
ncbi:unnamed protein product [Caenorhabditis sp. 36 PRJEB53466]|nr:unnamed protein product [Caenorhabditis sp. 36 PRJEB53466]